MITILGRCTIGNWKVKEIVEARMSFFVSWYEREEFMRGELLRKINTIFLEFGVPDELTVVSEDFAKEMWRHTSWFRSLSVQSKVYKELYLKVMDLKNTVCNHNWGLFSIFKSCSIRKTSNWFHFGGVLFSIWSKTSWGTRLFSWRKSFEIGSWDLSNWNENYGMVNMFAKSNSRVTRRSKIYWIGRFIWSFGWRVSVNVL